MEEGKYKYSNWGEMISDVLCGSALGPLTFINLPVYDTNLYRIW